MDEKKRYTRPEVFVLISEDLCDTEIPITGSHEAVHGDSKQFDFGNEDDDFDMENPLWKD